MSEADGKGKPKKATKVLTQQHKEKIRAALLGRKQSDAHVQKRAAVLRERYQNRKEEDGNDSRS